MNLEALIKDIGLQTLEIEHQAIARLIHSLDEHFVKAVQLILKTKGRVVGTGVGKSGIVMQKLIASFNSTGTPAVFVHANDAVHGDIGVLTKDDIVICMSKSGNTPEIQQLLPVIQRLGNPIVGISSGDQSFLAREADYFIHTPIEREADEHNIVPTTSTIVQMAIGDALTMSLMAARGFTAQQFAQFHPAGMLGKQLDLKVQDLYIQNECPKVKASDTLDQVILSMTSGRLGVTVVVENDFPKGIITDGDLRRMLERQTQLSEVKATDIMTTNPICIPADMLCVNALDILKDKSITQLVVVNKNGQYLGIVHLHDILQEGL